MNPAENIHYLFEQVEKLSDSAPKPSFDGGGGGGYDRGMEKRVEKLESEFTAIKVDLAGIRSNYATTTDIAKLGAAMQSEINDQTWKLVTFVCGFGTALVAATYFIAKHA